MGARYAQPGVGLAPRADRGPDAGALHGRARDLDDAPGPPPDRREHREVAPGAGIGGGHRIGLADRGSHLRDQRPLAAVLDDVPAATGGPDRVDVIALPERQRDRGPVDVDRVLDVLRGLELDERLAEAAAGGLAGVALD